MAATILVTLGAGVESGIVAGVGLSMLIELTAGLLISASWAAALIWA